MNTEMRAVRQRRDPARGRVGARSRAAPPRPRGEPAPGEPARAARRRGLRRRR